MVNLAKCVYINVKWAIIAAQSQTALSAYFTSNCLFGFAEQCACPAKTKHLYNSCTTPAQRLRRWTNIIQMS